MIPSFCECCFNLFLSIFPQKALFAPQLHQIVLPIFASYAMIWFLTMRRKVSTIPEIASTFTGMFYLGYVPSFWVRIRLIQAANQPVTLLRPIVGPFLDSINAYAKSAFPYFARSIHSPITYGSVFIFWTWLSIAFSDVGAYFTGRKYGNTKLGSIFPAAGAASPNKTVEGYLGGSATCALFATLGAWVMQWPYWYLTGPIHGISLAFLGLVGDLTASMLKRDSGLKDFGTYSCVSIPLFNNSLFFFNIFNSFSH
jgi:CDP-diglyceride synthetase